MGLDRAARARLTAPLSFAFLFALCDYGVPARFDCAFRHKNKNQLLDLLPGGQSGLQIMKFINASVNSSKNNSIWTDLSSI